MRKAALILLSVCVAGLSAENTRKTVIDGRKAIITYDANGQVVSVSQTGPAAKHARKAKSKQMEKLDHAAFSVTGGDSVSTITTSND